MWHFILTAALPAGGGRAVMVLTLLLAGLAGVVGAQEMTLDYLCRYNCQSGEPDHLMQAIEVGGDRAIVAGNRGLALIDLTALPPAGSSNYLYRLMGLNARDVYPGSGGFYYVNLHRAGGEDRAGLAVVRLNGNTLQHVQTLAEPEVLFEKMCVRGNLLYVAAHSHGLRVFSLANPASPALVGSLTEGLLDAFAVTVDGGTAYIADGAGGLKVVDVSDPTSPVLLAGEDLTTAIGTAEDVTLRDGRVYVAAGGAGLTVYAGGDPTQRTVVEIGGCAESLGWVGDYLAVGVMGGFRLLDVQGGSPVVVAGEETARRGSNGRLRLCHHVAGATGNRLLCADWNYVDVYELKPAAASVQADITSSHQRIRFHPDGGTQIVAVRNDGAATLNITSVTAAPAAFGIDYAGGMLQPGESVEVEVSYNGSASQGSGMVRFASNDPDENPLPIQVFGNTDLLDPGEMAINFELPLITRDHQTGEFSQESFELADHLGQVVWFQVYGSW